MTDTVRSSTQNLTEAANRSHPQSMTSEQLVADLSKDIRQAIADAVRDSKLEIRHILDPSQCGFVIRRHFDALMFGLFGFIIGFLAFAMLAIVFYSRLH